MKRDREYLDELVEFALSDLHNNRKLKKKIANIARDELKKYFMYHKVIQLINKNAPVSGLTEKELYNLSDFLIRHDILKDVNLSDYYDGEEMREALNDTPILGYDNSKGVTFENMVYNGNELKPQFVGFISYQDIAIMHEARIFSYNFATQRVPKTVTMRNRTEQIAAVDQKNVNEICEEVLKNKFEENTLTLNIRLGEGTRYVYNESTGKLWIPKDVELDELDGHHRITAIHKAWLKDKNIKGNMTLLIKHISSSQAKDFIRQEAKGTLNAKEDMELYDSSNNRYKLIEEINRYSNESNIFFNRITVDVETKNPLVFYQVFAREMKNAWSETLEGVSSLELFKVRDFICNFYSITYDLYMDKYKVDSIDGLKGSDVLNQTFISGLLYPACNMYNNNNKQIDPQGIEKMVNSFNMSKIEDYTYGDNTRVNKINNYRRKWKNVLSR